MSAIQDPETGMTSETSTLHSPANVEQDAWSEKSQHDPEKAITGDVSEPQQSGLALAEASSAAPPKNPWTDPASFPDGGAKAWMTVLGGMCAMFVSFGWINCVGVFQNYYQTHQLSSYSSSTIAWIPSLEIFIMFVGGTWVGRVYDNYGPRWLLLIGSFLHVFGLMMASISTEYYQFILSQGLCSPIGASMLFYPAMSCVVTWFWKKRSLALGITAAGSSLGGVIFPIMVNKLVGEVGFGWTMRICAFLILALCIISNLTLRARIPPHPRPVRMMDFISPLREPVFALLCLSMFLFFFGLFIPFTFIILEGTSRGVPANLAVYLVSILNAASVFGRTFPGWAADKFGRFNTMILMTCFTTILTLALWLPGHGTGAIVTYAVFFGFSSGSIVSLPPTLIAQISDVRQIGVRTGTAFTIVSFSVLVSSPIGGALVSEDRGSYVTLQIFSGVMMVAGSVLFIITRWKLAGLGIKVKV